MKNLDSSKVTKFSLILIVALLLLPIAVGVFKFLPKTPLNGIAIPDKYIPLTKKNLLSKKFQNSFESYLIKNNPMWGYGLKIGNQIYYSVFNQVSARLNNSVLAGNDGYFFQAQYLPSYNKTKPFKKEKTDKFLTDSLLLQEKLEKEGVTLVFLISPNLISLYPEILPDSYKDKTRDFRQNSYEYISPLLHNSKLNLVNSHEKLMTLKHEVPFKFFQKTGSHLNEIGVCHQVNGIFSIYAHKNNSLFTPIDCNNYSTQPTFRKDVDLVEIANLMNSKATMEPSLGVTDQRVGFIDGHKPKVLLIGTSFLFDFQKQLERFQLVESVPLLFYFRSVRSTSDTKLKGLRKLRYSIEELKKYDLIILETNQTKVSSIGNGFISKALKDLDSGK